MLETTLRPVHERLGARLVPFAGWTMPVHYAGILQEIEAVRRRAGLFDLGHMGRVEVRGGDATAFLQRVQTNDAATLAPGQIRYSMLLDDDGRTQDDILVYREPDGRGYFLVVNAGNSARDLALLRDAAQGFRALEVADRTAELGMFAIQGPRSQAIVQPLVDADLGALRYYRWTRCRLGGVPIGLSRTGYTGEDGFEFYVPVAETVALWNAVLEAGRAQGLEPAGLGARDTLRLEAGMPLYGHEIDETTTPLHAGLDWAVKFTHDFRGRAALERLAATGGPAERLIGIETQSRRVPRQGYPIWIDGRECGRVASGTFSPTLGRGIATVYVPREHAVPGRAVEFAIKDRREPATTRSLPFYQRAR
jgi:aminomethyltransferase